MDLPIPAAAAEFRSLKLNRALLEVIAKKTGGEVISIGSLESFAKGLPNREAPITESWTAPLWYQASVFLFALACFVAEWGLRRWKGWPRPSGVRKLSQTQSPSGSKTDQVDGWGLVEPSVRHARRTNPALDSLDVRRAHGWKEGDGVC